jgi:CDP-diacylglycerol pyrophosphatase
MQSTTGETVSNARVISWNPNSGLGAAYSSGQDQLHVYYSGLDLGVYEFLGNNASSTNTTWNSQPGRNHIWAEADYVGADIAAVGWSDQVRFFQQSDKLRVVQGSLSNTTWTEAFVI